MLDVRYPQNKILHFFVVEVPLMVTNRYIQQTIITFLCTADPKWVSVSTTNFDYSGCLFRLHSAKSDECFYQVACWYSLEALLKKLQVRYW